MTEVTVIRVGVLAAQVRAALDRAAAGEPAVRCPVCGDRLDSNGRCPNGSVPDR